MYTFESRVRYSEIGHKGTMTLPGIVNYFQDCSTFQSEDIGLGVEALKERKRAWVLSYWQVVVERFPRMGEYIQTGTFASGFKGLYGYRNFFIDDESGSRIAYANSVWVFMDIERGRPARPEACDIQPYGEEPPLEMEYEDRKITLSVSSESLTPFPVMHYHIDTNEHVNNCQYVQMALEQITDERAVLKLRAEYKKSAVYGDVIYPKVSYQEERTVVELCDEDGKAYAVVELKYR